MGADTYRYGESVECSITFSAGLDVEGSKHLNLRVGADQANNWPGANYREGSGTETLVFSYTVQPRDLDEDGISMGGSYTQDGEAQGFGGSGTITVSGMEIKVPPNFSGLTNESEHKVNGQPYARTISITSTPEAPTDTYGPEEIIRISVNFDQEVDADDRTYAVVGMTGIGEQGAFCVSGSGTDTLVFELEVQSDDRDADGISVRLHRGLNIKAGGTDIAYQSGPGVTSPVLNNQSGYKVDGSLVTRDDTAPTITAVTFADSPGPGDDSTYGEGDWIVVSVRFDEDVEVVYPLPNREPPQIGLIIGDVKRSAQYGVLPGTPQGLSQPQDPQSVLKFGYRVQEGDADTDGVSINADSVDLSGAIIQDRAGNDADLANAAVDEPDETAPTVESVAFLSDPGEDETYGAGDNILVKGTFSEDVTVTGAPQLEIDVGGTAKTAAYHKSEGAWIWFKYTVAVGDTDSDGIAIGENKLILNDGTIQDGAGNDAVLTHAAVAADSGPGVGSRKPLVASDGAEGTVTGHLRLVPGGGRAGGLRSG